MGTEHVILGSIANSLHHRHNTLWYVFVSITTVGYPPEKKKKKKQGENIDITNAFFKIKIPFH